MLYTIYMPRFKFLEHPEDIQFQAFGQDQKELFINSALALMTYLYPKYVDFKEHEAKTHINLKAEDSKSLLVDWLEKLIELTDEGDICYNEFHFKKINNREIEATIYGRRIRQRQHVKQVKYHNSKLEEKLGGFEAYISFDIKK